MTADDPKSPASAGSAPAASARRRRLRGYAAPGSAPGTLRVPANASPTSIEAHGYGPEGHESVRDADRDAIERLSASYPNIWLNVTGLADLELIRAIGATFRLHDLALEDVFHTQQRPKAEAYPDHHFAVARIPIRDDFPHTEQIAIFVGAAFVICFQERPGDCFDAVRTRLGDARSRIRAGAPSFLAYALLDAVIDSYFPVIEHMGDELEEVETAVLTQGSGDMMPRLHRAKRNVVELRRTIWPHREMINAILRDESEYFDARTTVYLRDCYDHVAQLMDIVEIDREFVSDLFDVHLSRINLRMNEIMKVLTTIATVFIPLSFIAGVYGMNFDTKASGWNMPELTWAFGYPFALGVMAVVAGGLVFYLYRRGWLSSQTEERRRGHRRRR